MLLVVGVWAMLAHLGFVAGPQLFDVLTLLYVLVLVRSLVADGRRGMLIVKRAPPAKTEGGARIVASAPFQSLELTIMRKVADPLSSYS